MVVCRCTQKFRDNANRIYGYRLVDVSGNYRDMKSDDLKQALLNKTDDALSYVKALNIVKNNPDRNRKGLCDEYFGLEGFTYLGTVKQFNPQMSNVGPGIVLNVYKQNFEIGDYC